MSEFTRRAALAAGLAMAAGIEVKAEPSVGRFSANALESFRAPAVRAVAAGDVPGVVSLVWRKGEVAEVNTIGLRDVQHKLPMERTTIFGVASMSKPVTVVVALMLAEQGKIKLEDPITKWAPEFADMRVLRRADGPLDDTYPAPRLITIEDLMTHRSGLSYAFIAAGPLAGALAERVGFGIDSPLTPDQWLKALATLPLAYAPGERFNYGHSIDVLGFILGRAAGTTTRQVFQEHLFGPLGMADTDFWIPLEKRDRMAVVYNSPGPGNFTTVSMPSFTGPTPMAYTSGGQGLVTTAEDYLTFARMLLHKGAVNGVRLLKPETVKLMTTNRLTPSQRAIPVMGTPMFAGQGFGLGVSVITEPEKHAWMGYGRAGAFGWPGAFGGWWQADPAEDMVLLWLQEVLPAAPTPNALPRMPGAAATLEFQKAVYAALNR